MTDVHYAEAQLKHKAIESSRQVIALIDSTKFGKEDLTPFARADQIARLITDDGLSAEWIEKLKQAHIEFTLCKEKATPIK